MKRIAQFLMRLYPANWRARYGDEFEALIEDSSPGWPGIFDLLKGAIRMQLSAPAFPKLALMLSVTGLLAGLGISFVVTPRFVSTAAMAFIPPNLTDVHRNVNEVFLELQTEILSRTSLSSIIQDPRLDLYKSERARMPLEDVIERMRLDLQISRDAPANTGGDYLPFHITFAYADRLKAQQTVMALMTKLQDANLTSQRMQAQAKRASTSDQVYRLEARIAALENRLGMPSAGHEPDFSSNRLTGINLDVLDPPSPPVAPVYPDRLRFMATGFGAGIAAAMVIAIFRRRPPPIPFPAQTA
jgi:hypothetical protein